MRVFIVPSDNRSDMISSESEIIFTMELLKETEDISAN